jgi:hypothetical protein
MKCPYCGKEIKDGAQACPYCWKDIVPHEQIEPQKYQEHVENNNSKPHLDDFKENSSNDLLSLEEKILTWVCVIFVPGGILIVSCIYYLMRRKKPQKAAKFNRTCWYAFFVYISIVIALAIIPLIFDSNTSSDDKEFMQYVQALKTNFDSSEGTRLSIDKQAHKIMFITNIDISKEASFDINGLKKDIMNDFKKTSDGQKEIEIIKAVNAIIVYRYVTKDNANIDVTIYPSDW